ncbi:hypothetical protein AY599_07150 [Leptolyngbya valderiana BDU 20041]|nr:hypothetical protein AY599_07150 [Leptolyngbya valderiana BDU 20041]
MSKPGAGGVVRARDHLPEHLAQRLERELDEGEGLLWVGRPDAGRLVRAQWFPFFVLAVMVMALGVAVFLGALDSLETLRRAAEAGGVPQREIVSARRFMWVGGVAGVLMQLPMVWALFFEPRRLRRQALHTIYAVTPARAIVLFVGARKTVERDYRADELTHLLRKERADGSGDLVFENARGGRPRPPSQGGPHGFYAVPGVLALEKLLRARFGDHGQRAG